MTAQIIDGKAYAAQLREKITQAVAKIKTQHNLTPGLAVVLVGEDPASQVYVRNKHKQTVEAGMASFEFTLPADTTQQTLLTKIAELNANPQVHGILVQLPLPKHMDERDVIAAIDPRKDVDGFHAINVGKLNTGQPDALVPCTPYGCLLLLQSVINDLSGKHAVVLGRSNIVGKPMAALLLQQSCTVTVAHSRTQNIQAMAKQADILVAAIGKPEIVTKNWVKEGTVVIDVGINRIERDGKNMLVGDVDFAGVSSVASAITPVPGGVGPMTIACLLRNTLVAFCQIHNITIPETV